MHILLTYMSRFSFFAYIVLLTYMSRFSFFAYIVLLTYMSRFSFFAYIVLLTYMSRFFAYLLLLTYMSPVHNFYYWCLRHSCYNPSNLSTREHAACTILLTMHYERGQYEYHHGLHANPCGRTTLLWDMVLFFNNRPLLTAGQSWQPANKHLDHWHINHGLSRSVGKVLTLGLTYIFLRKES